MSPKIKINRELHIIIGLELEFWRPRQQKVHRVKVRTKNNILERPFRKLCFLRDMS